MATLDELLAARAAGPAASAPASIDDMLAHRAQGGTVPVTAAALAEPSLWDRATTGAGNFVYGAVKGLADPAYGISQLALHGANAMSFGTLDKTTKQYDKFIKDVEDQYQGDTKGSYAAGTGRVLGNILPAIAGAGPLQAAGDLAATAVPAAVARAAPLIPKAVSAAAQGAAVGAAQPVTNAGGDTTLNDLAAGNTQAPGYAAQKATQMGLGAATGGAVTGIVAPAIRGVVNAARPLVAPQTVVSPLVAKLVGDDPATLAMLKNPPQLVPGSKATTAQLLATPEAVMTEKAFATQNPDFKTQLLNLSNSNNEARVAAVQGVAQTPQDLTAAISARRTAADPWTNSATGQLASGAPVDAQPIIDQLTSIQNGSLGTNPGIGKAANDVLASIQKGITNTGQGGTLVRPDLLDGIRQNVRSFLQDNSPTGAVSTKQEAAFEPVRSAIVDSIESANPGYRDYLATYAKNSTPINTMEAGSNILGDVAGAGRSANSAGDSQVTLSRFSSALAKALSGPHEIDPAAQSTLQGIQQDIQREGISNSIRSPGSDTAANLSANGWLTRALYGDNFSGSTAAAKTIGGALGAAGGYLGEGWGAAAGGAYAGSNAMGALANVGQSRVNSIMARALTDPEFAAQLAAQAQPQPPSALLQAVPQLGLLQ